MKTTGIKLYKSRGTPLYFQLFEALKQNIISGDISDGEKLPSRRRLMSELSVSKSTAEQAYRLLEEEGYALSKAKSGYYARSESPLNKNIAEPDYYHDEGIVLVMSHHATDPLTYPEKEITKLYRDTVYDMPKLYGLGHKFGEKELRQAVSSSLNNLHGFGTSPDRVIIGGGTEYLTEQLVHIFPSGTVFGFENACFARSYIPVKNSGAKITLIDNSLTEFPLEKLKQSDIDIMYVSPDGQYPTNHRMTEEERKALLDWAYERENRYIIEADFDLDISLKGSEETLFRMDKKDRIIFMGTFAKSIAPSLKTSYIVLPKTLKEAFNKALPYYVNLASRFEQQTIAKYIKSGKYADHCRFVKDFYTQKRNLLKNELKGSPLSGYTEIFNSQSGIYFIISVNNGMNKTELKEAAYKNGVKILPVCVSYIKSKSLPGNLFLAGFGGLTPSEIKDATARLTGAWLPKVPKSL